MAPGSIAYDIESEKLITGSYTAASQSVDLSGPNSGTVVIQLTNTWVGTLIAEGSIDGTNYTTLPVKSQATQLWVPSITSNGTYLVASNGYVAIRLRSSAWTSGTATLTAYGSNETSIINSDAIIRGGTDGTVIGNNTDRLKVDANFTVLGGQLVPTITNKMRVRYSTTPATAGAAYSTIYTRSGTGLFFGFQTDFNSANVFLRLTIDGGQIFEVTVSDLKLFQFNDTSATRNQAGGWWSTIGNTVDFSSKFAIPYSTTVTLEMKRSDGTNHTMSQYMVFLTEDT